MLSSLKELLLEANREHRALPCFNIFNLDFLASIISASEEEKSPVIISLNQDMVKYYSLEVIVPLLLAFAKQAQVPICPHLDHTYDPSTIKQALDLGLPSVMYDGSSLPLEENISITQKIGKITAEYQADLEGEVGSVAYADHDPQKAHIRQEITQLQEAIRMVEETSLTALAVSVGNVHRLSEGKVRIDFDHLLELSEKVSIPLVIHGTSGIDPEMIKRISQQTTVAKFNIATDLRMTWGHTLRHQFQTDPKLYDPLECTRRVHPYLKDRVKYWIDLLRN